MFAEPPAAVAAAVPPVITAADLQAGRAAGHKAGPAKGAGAAAMPTVKLLDLGMACLYDPAKPQRGERKMTCAVGGLFMAAHASHYAYALDSWR